MTAPPKLFVLVDDKREPPSEEGVIIVRDPRVALNTLCMLTKIHTLAMDNDMGHGWEFEGRNILKRFLEVCQAETASYPAFVLLVTSNGPAASDMAGTLRQHGYTREGVDRWVKF